MQASEQLHKVKFQKKIKNQKDNQEVQYNTEDYKKIKKGNKQKQSYSEERKQKREFYA